MTTCSVHLCPSGWRRGWSVYMDGAADQACHTGEVPVEWRKTAACAVHLHHTSGPGAGPPAL